MGNCCCKRKRAKIGSRPSRIEVDPTNCRRAYSHKTKRKSTYLVAAVVTDPSQDSDSKSVSVSGSGSGSGSGSLYGDESSICETLYHIDPAWDTDAGSRFGSVSPSLCSVSSFGSFSGPGCFSDSCSSDETSDFGSMITSFSTE